MSSARPRYESLEHTSEAGIIARGATLAEAFANIAEGMYDLMLELDGVEERESREIALEDQNSEALLVDWLLELLFLTETEGLVFRRFAVDELSETRLRARVWGERFDPERHRSHNVVVKAVTHYLLEIGRENGGYRVQVLFDI
ncbi:MAG: archease [Chloroflexi bacterium]|nr:archease [Chloroflexota bacterium]